MSTITPDADSFLRSISICSWYLFTFQSLSFFWWDFSKLALCQRMNNNNNKNISYKGD